MNIDRLHEPTDEWKTDAGVLRKRGAAVQAEALESCAADLGQTLQEWQNEELTLHQAAGESGYSYSALQQMKDLNVSTFDVAAAGGWKDTQSLKSAYQQADTETMLRVVLEAGELREVR